MARVPGERAPAFTSEELEKPVDGVLPQYMLLYGPPDKQVCTLGACRMGDACVERAGCQRPPEERYLACHRQGRPDPGGLPQTEHPLPEKMGGQSPLEQEDGGGSAGDGLPMWEGCLSHHDPPDVQDLGGGLLGVGWAFEGITAATRGSRTSTSATTSSGPVVLVVTGIWSAPATRAANVAQSHSTDSPPPVKHQKLASARWERVKTPATKAAPRGPVGSVESAVTPSKVGKGHKKPSKCGKSCTAEKTAIIPAAQEATASTSPAAQQATASTSPAVQEATASTSPAAQPPPAQAQLPRRPPPAPAQLPRRPAPAQAQLPRRPPPAQAQLPRRPPPAKGPLGHEGPPAKGPLGHEGPPAAETLQWRPPSDAPLNRAPPSEALLNRAPPSEAPLNRALPSEALLAHERKGH
ncbi:hypothetical protein NDU88_007349 [Pleurodeles waltl]|uniref:Uncharacterized protein n=1 Tax=Pleurodeles waltl TaxID=8319 RepID=A0AAV7NXQ0_PLEWA|nr:hypothetical protein NDU88_007349 [Pleurodeles waltl]